MNRENAEHIIETLLAVAERDKLEKHTHFYMGSWIKNKSTIPNQSIVECNTSACALGWEATTPYAHERGLHITPDGWPIFTEEWGEYREGFGAGQRYLDVSAGVSRALFDPICYTDDSYTLIKPQHVIERIKYFLAGGQLDEQWDNFADYARTLPGGLDD